MKSFFQTPVGLQIVEVEVKLLPGIPILHIVGQPDPHIKECALRIKAALKSSGFQWPKGRQIVVNLRPTYLRKHSRGLELAIVVGILLESGQVTEEFVKWSEDKVFYGEVGLSGEIFAPEDVASLIVPENPNHIVTGPLSHHLLEGHWWSARNIGELSQAEHNSQRVDWSTIFQRPELPPFDFNATAADLLKVSALMSMSTLLAGPQGSGKTTWARALHALTTAPEPQQFRENLRLTGSALTWRALETPHHTTPALAMVGGGSPLRAGVVTKAHGGVLVMDEFLQFEIPVLEALREPLETGRIHLNRVNSGIIFPAQFQLIATTNLCPCGKRAPGINRNCGYSLPRCKSTWQRLSGPLMDRFELIGFSHLWTSGVRVDLGTILKEVERAREFQKTRGFNDRDWPTWLHELPATFRRKRALMRVARGLADLDGSLEVTGDHWVRAKGMSTNPIEELRQLYG